MVKVREYFCGCSVRSGMFSIAWCSLIYACYLFMKTMFFVALAIRHARITKGFTTDIELDYRHFILAYNVIKSIAGIAVSITALWALHKNKAKFLSGLFWYLCFIVGANILNGIVIIFVFRDPKMESVELDIIIPLFFTSRHFESKIPFLVVYTFLTVIISYFAFVVKRFRDYLLINDGLNVQFIRPDATAVGYVQVA